tara:strand:+ start:1457 stop:3526 length:2070 start_codon:yes stop_codon:yes gene_type:complete
MSNRAGRSGIIGELVKAVVTAAAIEQHYTTIEHVTNTYNPTQVQVSGPLDVLGDLSADDFNMQATNPILTMTSTESGHGAVAGISESKILFRGANDAGTITERAEIRVDHDGAVDDLTTKIVIQVNSGADADGSLSTGLTMSGDLGTAFTGDMTVKTGDGAILNLQTSAGAIGGGNVLGRIDFQAPDETDEGDAALAGASIRAIAETGFTDVANPTELAFYTAATGAMVQHITIGSTGLLTTTAGITNSAGEVLVSGGNVQLNDDIVLSFGNSDDTTMEFDNNDTGDFVLTNTTGNLRFESVSVTDSILMDIGSTDANTSFEVRDPENATLFSINGVGTGSVTGPFTGLSGVWGAVTDASATSVLYPIIASHSTTHALPAVGIGCGITFITDTQTPANLEIGSRIASESTDVGDGTEAFDLVFYNMAGGIGPAERFRILSTGAVTVAGVSTSEGYIANLPDGDGDVTIKFQQGGITAFVAGIDDFDNIFKIHSGTELADTSDIEMDAAGVVTFNGNVNAAALTVSGDTGTFGAGLDASEGYIYAQRFGGVVYNTIYLDLAPLRSGASANAIIGENDVAGAHMGQITVAQYGTAIKAGRITCMETPAGGNPDIDVYQVVEATGEFNDDIVIDTFNETILINRDGNWAAGDMRVFETVPTTGIFYLYLATGSAVAEADYTAGKFLIEFWGA